MLHSPIFALNHIAAPNLDFQSFVDLARSLDIADIEIRNDTPDLVGRSGLPPKSIRAIAEAAGVRIRSINALQRFNVWNEERAAEATALADFAVDCGAAALVLCPVNSFDDRRDEAQRRADLSAALAGLAPLLAGRGLVGLVEPLGFAESSLREKRVALEAIDATGNSDRFLLLHDTFHHALSGETSMFPARTGLVHISGVEERDLALTSMRDTHRILVGERDLLRNVSQIRDLLASGYRGPLSFEPFAESVQTCADPATAVSESIAYIRAAVN